MNILLACKKNVSKLEADLLIGYVEVQCRKS